MRSRCAALEAEINSLKHRSSDERVPELANNDNEQPMDELTCNVIENLEIHENNQNVDKILGDREKIADIGMTFLLSY